MTENKKRKPYVKPSMEVIEVETMSILAGSGPERKSRIANFENDDYWEEVEVTE